ncbi:uncharacterized protein LOC131013525 isoform X2 [Salvia miltiorrhiza]|uniref:uncharacterized protein LOC131013525 isoform X2 n=1 Tax=Salvia miltiorrhiza TaxID=226208 RepID=UPI0025AB62BB|nr:uncharacterized protein LOC131013525 isoform X2 [Salvia miltiorrhiza]XP_057797623.1 uncharacterized protein LOC131013525 isoform X2 [Salvia miltiorrhiza]XP_057797624.1 uncharacterized protein LOC131013525 isoform X2 [Salvia miltiorrhiza]XP_057797625.1 uncharacterized protein LOC131013525 isoform X2 [Salvia miltiorrhiza]XP_057797626.1 uncharacterized protein LOC131013525 isoform X2 [Salvia miltiorrhiza]
MAKKRGRAKKQPVIEEQNCNEEGDPLEKKDEAFDNSEVERQCAAIRALRDVEIEQFGTMLRLLRSYFSEDQLQVPVLQFFRENLPNLSLEKAEKDGQYEVKWKQKDVDATLDHADERTLHAALLRRLSLAYPDFSAGIPSLGGFEFSNQSVKTSLFAADKLQIRSLVFDEPSDSQMLEPRDDLQTPNVSNNRLSVGITPKTKRLPKCGEMLLSIHGSPLGVFKEDNMETIQESEDG